MLVITDENEISEMGSEVIVIGESTVGVILMVNGLQFQLNLSPAEFGCL